MSQSPTQPEAPDTQAHEDREIRVMIFSARSAETWGEVRDELDLDQDHFSTEA